MQHRLAVEIGVEEKHADTVSAQAGANEGRTPIINQGPTTHVSIWCHRAFGTMGRWSAFISDSSLKE